MKCRLLILLFAGTMCTTATPSPIVIYVDGSAPGADNGSSWKDSFRSLFNAIDSIRSPIPEGITYEIRVAAGVYTPDGGSGSREQTFRLSSRVALRGSYAGYGAPDPDARDREAYETILSGDLKGDDAEVANPRELLVDGTREDNAYHVVTAVATDSTAILEAFTITGGIADKVDGEWPDWKKSGGGLYASGDGLSDQQSRPTVMHCTFRGNAASELGGGLFAGGSPSLINCRFVENWAGQDGGGVKLEGGNPRLSECTFRGNGAERDGGGIDIWESDAVLVNCVFSGNTAGRRGGGLVLWYSFTVPLMNCTFAGNSAQGQGGGFCIESDRVIFTNCILWGNGDGDGTGESSQIHSLDGNVKIDYSCVQGWSGKLGGTGNIDADPHFADPWAEGCHLQPGSPCIDAGTSEGAPTTDIEGRGRPCGAGVDIGAYESGDCPISTERFKRGDADGNGELQITDAIKLLGYLFLGEGGLPCLDASDVDDSGKLDLTDAVYSLSYQFMGGPPPVSPFAECGIDPVVDALDCQSFAAQCP